MASASTAIGFPSRTMSGFTSTLRMSARSTTSRPGPRRRRCSNAPGSVPSCARRRRRTASRRRGSRSPPPRAPPPPRPPPAPRARRARRSRRAAPSRRARRGCARRPRALARRSLRLSRHSGKRYCAAMRMLHTMLRVGNLERSLRFYCDVLGMRLLRRKDYPDGRFTLAFVGYGNESDHTVVELTHNWDTERYELGNAFGHLALGVEDIYRACGELRDKGAKIV